MTRVLLAEDDASIADPLSRALLREGYQVTAHADGQAALEAATTQEPDLVILDLGLPTLDGLEVCRRLRATGATVPVLILTARADEVDTVVGLDAGGDDYVTKPFRLAELMARVRALLRRQPSEQQRPAEDTVQVDPEARRAWFHGEELPLTTKEYEVLRVLVRESGKVVSREQLMAEVWETEWFGSTKTLDMHVSVLRRKLGDDPAAPRHIATVRGIGFRFDP
ncbi:response regulator transcription factor [Janibacter alkaliphilus]|uniref:DNA-binding response OmpR family regulator n=1 Tax=Janibacter alkaliphilus TaxID=1069963 RepID=A0A852X303_9MICO|nr:response regulator transcription factor [Janibacter alkaliphilus]NYG35650.1 DNA-binding response OmpR family regulator [Janibacter alkaliphilus]